jgi:16S rRNA (guanine(966)-N(2))-methyltransferase RsmD
MRVIAGALKGRRLTTPTWEGLRPTSERLRETLFDILGDRVVDAEFIDLFAGTGAVGIEALSRGAAHVTFVESDGRAVRLIAENLRRCGREAGYTILRGPLRRAWRRMGDLAANLIFLDPPYEFEELDDVVTDAAGHLAAEGLLVVEHATRRALPDTVDALRRVRHVSAGDSTLSFYATVANGALGDAAEGEREQP